MIKLALEIGGDIVAVTREELEELHEELTEFLGLGEDEAEEPLDCDSEAEPVSDEEEDWS